MWIAVAVLGLLFHQEPSAGPGRDRALFDAARLGDTARIRELLAAGADVTLTDARGFTALMWACAAASPEAVQLLLDAGAPASHAAGDGTTALLLAASNGLEDIVRRLLARGPDVFAAKAGVTPRQAAASRGHTAIAARLEAAEDLGRRLLQAAADGQPEVVRQVVALGAPVNARNEQGASALMFVARHGDVALMQFLLARGADPRARDADGASVYDWATRSSSTVTYVTEFLRDRGVAAEAPTARAASEAPPVSSSLRALQASLARIAPESDPQRAAHRRAGAALARLQELAAQWPADSPDDYRASLADHGRTLDAAIDGADRGRLADTLQALAEDLEVKLEHCLASGGRLGGSVTVRVRTVQNARETGSWQVFYMPKVFEASATASPDLFPQLSSPTEETLVPGRYLMWLRNPATGIVGERTVVKVGEGRQELVVDLAVPGGGSQFTWRPVRSPGAHPAGGGGDCGRCRGRGAGAGACRPRRGGQRATGVRGVRLRRDRRPAGAAVLDPSHAGRASHCTRDRQRRARSRARVLPGERRTRAGVHRHLCQPHGDRRNRAHPARPAVHGSEPRSAAGRAALRRGR